jgi:competence protein ComEC
MNQMVKRPFILIFIFFGFGIFCGEKAAFPIDFVLAFIFLLFFILLFLSLKNKNSLIFPLLFFYFAGALFIYPHSKFEFNSKAQKFELYKDEKRNIKAVVIKFPEFSYSRLKTKIKLISLGKKNLESENLKFSLSIYDYEKKYRPGDIINFSAQIKPFTNFKNPGAFDYKSYMRFKGFYGHMWASGTRVETSGKKNSLVFFIEDLRFKIAEIIDKNIKDGKKAEFLKSVTCGIKNGLDKEFKENASKAGASHFMAISGLHIGMIFSFFFLFSKLFFSRFSFFLWRGWVKKSAVGLGILGAFFYALLSGLMPSAQRAFILALLGGAGFFLNKKHDPLNILFCCGFFILVLTPQFLFNVGFILSFLAVFSIVVGFMAFPEKTEEKKPFFYKLFIWIKILFKTSLFAVSGTAPAAVYYFNILPLSGIFTSVFLIPLFSFILLPFAFAGILSSLIFPKISSLFFYPASFSTGIFIKTVSAVSEIKFTYVDLGISLFELLLIYLCLLIIFWGLYNFCFKFKFSLYFKSFSAIILILVFFDIFHQVDKRFFNENGRIVFFDTGKGNSALIVFPGGKTALIDAGGFPGSDFDTGKYIIAPYLLKNKIKTIDVCISTHGDYDHYYGFFYILDRFKVNKFVFNNTIKNNGSYKKLITKAKQGHIFSKPEKIDMKKGIIDFLQREDLFEDENDNSLLTCVAVNNFKILFTGDLYKKSQEYYKDKKFIKNTDVFLVPHHGSIHSLNKKFTIAASPKLAVISGSFRNYEKTQKKVSEIYEDLGITVYNINKKGALTLDLDKLNLYSDL